LLNARNLLTEPVVLVDCFSQLAEPHLAQGDRGSEVLEHLVRTLKQVNEAGTTILLTIHPVHMDGIDTSPLTAGADIRPGASKNASAAASTASSCQEVRPRRRAHRGRHRVPRRTRRGLHRGDQSHRVR
jgi:hypothetical protein